MNLIHRLEEKFCMSNERKKSKERKREPEKCREGGRKKKARKGEGVEVGRGKREKVEEEGRTAGRKIGGWEVQTK